MSTKTKATKPVLTLVLGLLLCITGILVMGVSIRARKHIWYFSIYLIFFLIFFWYHHSAIWIFHDSRRKGGK